MDSLELLRELRRAVEGLKAFNDVGRRLTSTLDPREVLDIILTKVGETFRPAAWALLLANEQRNDLEIHLAVGESTGQLPGSRLRAGEGIVGWVAQSGQPVLLEDARKDPRFVEGVDPVPPGGPHAFMAVPLRSFGGTLGSIALTAGSQDRFAPDDLRTLTGLADYAAIALSNARNFERVRELTLVDDHTSLYNSRHLHRTLDAEVARAGRYHRALSLVFFDLDHFKRVNDLHGHQAGSELLREVGDVMRGALRTMDVPVRYGGDEFVVVLPETGHDQVRIVAERLRLAIRSTTFLQARGLDVQVTASFGTSTWPDDGLTAQDLLRAADAAMYRAKKAGRDGVARGG